MGYLFRLGERATRRVNQRFVFRTSCAVRSTETTCAPPGFGPNQPRAPEPPPALSELPLERPARPHKVSGAWEAPSMLVDSKTIGRSISTSYTAIATPPSSYL